MSERCVCARQYKRINSLRVTFMLHAQLFYEPAVFFLVKVLCYYKMDS